MTKHSDELLGLPAPHETDTPRVETCIQDAMRRFPGYSTSAQARYYEEVHQELAPLARDLERELAKARARITELEANAARYLWFRDTTIGVREANGHYRFGIPTPRALANIMRGSVAQHLDAAIDAHLNKHTGDKQ